MSILYTTSCNIAAGFRAAISDQFSKIQIGELTDDLIPYHTSSRDIEVVTCYDCDIFLRCCDIMCDCRCDNNDWCCDINICGCNLCRFCAGCVSCIVCFCCNMHNR